MTRSSIASEGGDPTESARTAIRSCQGEVMKFSTLIIAAISALAAGFAHAADPVKFACSGSLIQPSGDAPAQRSLQMTIGPSNKVAIDLGQGIIHPTVSSNNQIQLKFTTKDYVGEFFHYTGDLFLIYKSGHLARLACTRG
jgi:hypothetical protein